MLLTAAPKLRSPSLPLLHPRDPLAWIVDLAERCHGDDRPDCPILEELAGR